MQTETQTEQQDVRQKAEQTASTIAQQAQETATTQLSSQKERAASTLSTLAGTLRESGHNVRQDQPQIASLTDQAAQRVEGISEYIREHDVRELVGEVESFARREPAIFLGAAFAVGFLAARLLKASSASSAGGGQAGFATRSGGHEGYRWNPDTAFGSSGRSGEVDTTTTRFGGSSATGFDTGATGYGDVGTARYSGFAEEPAAIGALDTPSELGVDSATDLGGDASAQQEPDASDEHRDR